VLVGEVGLEYAGGNGFDVFGSVRDQVLSAWWSVATG